MLISAIWLGHYGHFLTFGEMLMALYALFKLFFKTLKKGQILQTEKGGNLEILYLFLAEKWSFVVVVQTYSAYS